jgi:hypothetical protein
MKIVSTVLFAALCGSQCANVDSFSAVQSSSVSSARNTALHATVEKTVLKSPADIPDDDIPGMFEQYVCKTYG